MVVYEHRMELHSQSNGWISCNKKGVALSVAAFTLALMIVFYTAVEEVDTKKSSCFTVYESSGKEISNGII